MPKKPPKLVPINHDDYHAQYIGRTSDGKQFFLTTPFVPAGDEQPGCEFVALYVFSPPGELLDAKIDSLGPRAELDDEKARELQARRLAELGDVTYRRIKVAPFTLERFGVEFGLVPRPPESEDDDWWVEVEPGNYMAFTAPWNGDYDT